MARLKVFGIFDVKADCYPNGTFVLSTNGQAVRAFADLARDSSSGVGKHPEDYKLVVLGTFDDATGELRGFEVPESLGFASEFIRPKEE